MSNETELLKSHPYIDNEDVGDVEIIEAHLSGFSANYVALEMVQQGSNKKNKNEDPRFVHDDLKNAFKKLNAHMAVICEEVSLTANKDIEDIVDYDPDEHAEKSLEYKLSRFHCTGFKVKGKADGKGVVLVGYKLLSTDKSVSLETPKITYGDADYKFVEELFSALYAAITEVDLYRTGKAAPTFVQSEMDFNASSDEDNGEKPEE